MDPTQYQIDDLRRRIEKIERGMEENGWREYRVSVKAMLSEWNSDRDWRGRVKTQLAIIGTLATIGVAGVLNLVLRWIVPS